MWSLIDRISGTGSTVVGNHRFIFGGLITLGPQIHYLLIVLVLSLIAEFAVLSLVCYFHIAMGIVFLILSTVHMGLMLSVALTDPGIVPPSISSRATTSPALMTSIVNGTKVDQKWCHSCNIHTPPRGKHCTVCGCCVDKHDHHCKFLSNCIGVRNYRTFVLFLISSCVVTLFVVLTILFRPSSTRTVKVWIIFVVSVVLFILSANLVRYHVSLVLRGATSFEQFRGSFAIEDNEEAEVVTANPFSLGSWRANLNAFLTTPTEPSRIASRAAAQEEMTTLHPTA